MTRRRANTLLILLGCLYLLVIGMAIVLTLRDRTKPSVFVAPVIWSIPHTGGEPRIEFNI